MALVPFASVMSGTVVAPTYPFPITYVDGGGIHPHLDVADNELSLTFQVHLRGAQAWPLTFLDPRGQVALTLTRTHVLDSAPGLTCAPPCKLPLVAAPSPSGSVGRHPHPRSQSPVRRSSPTSMRRSPKSTHSVTMMVSSTMAPRLSIGAHHCPAHGSPRLSLPSGKRTRPIATTSSGPELDWLFHM